MNTVSKGDTPKRPAALEEAIRLLHAGFWPVAITPPGQKTKWLSDPGKQPIGKAWGETKPDEPTLVAVWAAHPDAGLGIKLGCRSGMIDVEIDDPEKGEDSFTTLMGGECIETMGWLARRGSHNLFRWNDRLAKYGKTVIKIPSLPGLEIRIGELPGKPAQLQSVCPPSPITTDEEGRTVSIGHREWNGVEEIASLPDLFFKILDEQVITKKTKTTIPKSPPMPQGPDDACELALANELLGYVDADDYDSWVTAGMALHARFQGNDSAFHLWDEWSKRSTKYEAGETSKKWASFEAGGGVTFGSLYAMAQAAGYRGATKATLATKGLSLVRPLEPHGAATKATEATKGGSEHGSVALVAYVAPEEDEPVIVRPWPDPPESAAYRGPIGAIAEQVSEHTEADPAGILVQLLLGWGNVLGRAPCFYVGATRHGLNEFACMVGPTSSGRKGTGKDVALMVLGYADEVWRKERIRSGLSSGEGLIWEVRDPITKMVPEKKNGRIIGHHMEVTDQGVDDKRMFVVESEFGGTLKTLTREGNTLSARMRDAWDDGNLRAMTKNNLAQATNAHITIIGHITELELIKHLSETDAANGFANRFLWVSVRRTQLLPRGLVIPAECYEYESKVIRQALLAWRNCPGADIPFEFTDRFQTLWDELYMGPMNAERPGLLGAILARNASHTKRLACMYAALDSANLVDVHHLESAWALWCYCERSAARIYGDNLGDKDAETLLSALRSNPLGLSQTEIVHDVFRGHKNRKQIVRILGRLLESRLVHSEQVATGGRPATVWHATKGGES